MRTDPTENGGLFVGRRPGTRPIRYRALPRHGSPVRQTLDRGVATVLLITMVAVCLLFWGPLPVAWMWVGSQVDYWSGSTFLGMVIAFFGLLMTLLFVLMIMRRLDLMWISVLVGALMHGGVLARLQARMRTTRSPSGA